VKIDRVQGGRLDLAYLGAFDSLNPYNVKALSTSQGLVGNVYQSLMARSLDEPFTLYGLIARSIETDDSRDHVVFHLDPRAHFSDGGPITAADVLFMIASGKAGFDVRAGFASNGYGAHSPGGYSLLAGFLAEVVLTAFFLIVVMGATDSRAPKGFAGLAIGLCLTLIHLVCIPITNTSVNPARSTGPAIFAGGWALQQLWMFWVAPLIGGALGGGIYRALFSE